MAKDHFLSTGSIIEAAEIAVGAHGMVDEGLSQRVDRLLTLFRRNTDLSIDQKIATRRQVVKLLSRRLGIAADVMRHPEILDEEILDPIFVVGFPRTGTSIQQALLATDPANRTVGAWQTREPSPPPGERPVARYRRNQAADEVRRFVERTPGMMALHPYWDALEDTLTEDEEILAIDFRNSYPTFLYDVPSLDYMIRDEDIQGSYAFLKLFMQHQQWNLPKRRWVMKGVDHQRHLSKLFEVFSDAHCLFAHRDPAEFMASNMAIGAVVYAGITAGTLDRKTQGAETLKDFKERLAAMLSDPALDDQRVTHLPFRQFINDPVGVLESCYEKWDFAWTEKTGAAMRAWLADPANDGNRYGRQKYAFEAFGINWEVESPAFDLYRRRFLAPAEDAKAMSSAGDRA